MGELLQEIWAFLKHPVYQEDENETFKYRFSIFLKLLAIAVAISFVLGILIGLTQASLDLDFGTHAMESSITQYGPLLMLFIAVVVAPLLEESFFRAPLWFFKNQSYFKIIFYLFTLSFGFIHIYNYESSATILALSPLLVSPQISVGVFLGFIRVKFGFLWAVLLHATYNLIFVGPILLIRMLDGSVV